MTRIIEYTASKRKETLEVRGLDFEDTPFVLEHPGTLIEEDTRKEYPERRYNAVGELESRIVHVTFCIRGNALRIISMRYAKRKERKIYEERNNRA